MIYSSEGLTQSIIDDFEVNEIQDINDHIYKHNHSQNNIMPQNVDNYVKFIEDNFDNDQIDIIIRKLSKDKKCDPSENPNPEYIIRDLLKFIGEDPSREGLLETPRRVLKAWKEWGQGYSQNPADVFKCFKDGAEKYDTMIILDAIPINSFCEHHMAAIEGVCHIAYIPDGKIAGLSKFVRLANVFAHRLQVQERLTTQIADAIQEHLQPKGCAVVIKASHACMSSRGVRTHGVLTTTSALRGVFLEDGNNARGEFLSLINSK
jgi:GTP cyclohydrolase I